jgi:protein-tyrosine phosphatase
MNTSHQRVIKFRGFSNFRDLGGYPVDGDAQVKWGVLYRSGHLAKMKSSDLTRFKQLGIDTIIDFRSDPEREKDPNRLPDSLNLKTLSIPILDPSTSSWAAELRTAIQNREYQDFDPSEKMREWYQELAVGHVGQYRQFIHGVLNAQGAPVLWHCTAGKDRTGFAAAILLRILGVKQEIVEEDYMLSAKYADQRKALIWMLRLSRGKEAAKIIQTLFQVQKQWIEAAFQAIDVQWGDFKTYSHEALGLSTSQVDQLRDSLLEHVIDTIISSSDHFATIP